MAHKRTDTGRLNARPDSSIYVARSFRNPATNDKKAMVFQQVPAVARPQYKSMVWRILLQPLGSTVAPMALELCGDVIFGVSHEGETPLDVDLAQWQGRRYGVSRRHLTLRPSFNKLYVIDLGSTNGTYVNGLPIGRSWAYALKDEDVISLSKLHLRLHIVKGPTP